MGNVFTKLIEKPTPRSRPSSGRDLQHGRATTSRAVDDPRAIRANVPWRPRQQAAIGELPPGRYSALATRGTPQIEVTFDIDANGILHVGAKDKGTGKENKITIKANSGLSEAEIEQMVKDAEVNAADDKKKLELIQARNSADTLIHSVRKNMAEHGDKLEAAEKEKVEAALKGRRGIAQERRQGSHRSQDGSADDGEPEARREGLRRRAGGTGCSRFGGRCRGASAGGSRRRCARSRRRQRGRCRVQGSQEVMFGAARAGRPDISPRSRKRLFGRCLGVAVSFLQLLGSHGQA